MTPSAKSVPSPAPCPAPILAVWQVGRALLSDHAIQHGIKCGLAAILAWWVAQYIRLPNPTWALITVFVLALAPYVGSMGEKGLLRIVGTLIGGFLGMLLVGNFADNIVIIVGGVFVILTVSTWLFGWNRFPYAFFLCALTTNVVVTSGLSDPDNSWSIAIHRFLEVSIGVGSTLLVNSLLWPRYARTEFKEKLAESLREIRTLYADAISQERVTDATVQGIESSLMSTLVAIRLLLRYGAAESLPFRRRVPVYIQIIPEFALLFFSVFALRRTGGSSEIRDSKFRDAMHELERELLILIDLVIEGQAGKVAEQNASLLSKISDASHLLESHLPQAPLGTGNWTPSPEAVTESALLVTLEDVTHHVTAIAEHVEALESPPPGNMTVDTYSWTPRIRSYWLHSAIKGAIATCVALILCDWLHPPGANLIPLAAWLMVVLSRGYVHGEGDRRCFQYVAWTALFMIGFCGLLFLGAPLMASYAVTNVFLFLALFVFGYNVIKIGGITFPLQILLLAGCSVFGLNAQEPVAVQAVVGVFFGIVAGVLIGAVVQRLIWPLLPPHELKNALVEFLSACRDFIGETRPDRIQILRVTMTSTPAEMLGWIQRLDTPDVPEREREKWQAFIDALREMGASMRALMRLFRDPKLITLTSRLSSSVAAQHEALKNQCDELIAAFDAHSTSELAEIPARLDLPKFMQAFLTNCDLSTLTRLEELQLLGLAQRWLATEGALAECRKRAAALELPKYFGDYAL